MDVDDTEIFIETVRKCPHLYDITLEDYKDIVKKETTWRTIADMMKIEVSEAKKKWKNLRDTFAKLYAKSKRPRRVNCGPPRTLKWKYFDAMLFLSDTVRPRRTFSIIKIDAADTEQDTQQGEYEEEEEKEDLPPSGASGIFVEPSLKKPKEEFEEDSDFKIMATLPTANVNREENNDTNETFGRYVAAQIRELPHEQQPLARFKIGEVLFHMTQYQY